MRIGVNALYLIPGGVGGTEIYLRSLLPELDFWAKGCGYEVVVFTNRETGPLPDVFWATRSVETGVRATNRLARICFEQFRLPALLRREGVEVLLNPGFTAPLAAGCPQVTVFHDLQHKRHPEYFRWFDLPAWRFLLWAAARRSMRLIAVSDATRDDLLRYYPFLKPDRIDVVQHGVDEAFHEMRERREPSGFLLCPSTTHPHKNHALLLEAFGRLRQERPGLRLVLTGVRGFVQHEVEQAIRARGLEESVELRGWLPREDLYELFRTAAALVYPTRFEGFGLPVAEALAAGLPVACSDIEPLRTIARGDAHLFAPDDVEAMLAALRAALTAPRPPVSPYNWRRCAKATLTSLVGAQYRWWFLRSR